MESNADLFSRSLPQHRFAMKMVSARSVNYSDVIMFEIRNQQENLVQNGILNASGFLWTNDAKLK